MPATFHGFSEAGVGILTIGAGIFTWRGGERLLFPQGADHRARRRRAVTQAARERIERRDLNDRQHARLRSEGIWSLGIGITLLVLAGVALWNVGAMAGFFGDPSDGGF